MDMTTQKLTEKALIKSKKEVEPIVEKKVISDLSIVYYEIGNEHDASKIRLQS